MLSLMYSHFPLLSALERPRLLLSPLDQNSKETEALYIPVTDITFCISVS